MGYVLFKRGRGSNGVCLNSFFAFYSRTPHDSKHPSRGGAEEKRSWYDFGLGGSS